MSPKRIDDAALLDELRRVASIAQRPISQIVFKQHSSFGLSTYEKRFGTWLQALEAAGLPPAYRFGGIWQPCPICGQSFRFEGGAKARKTCPRDECKKEFVRRTRGNFKGDAASKQAARGRAKAAKPGDQCERCGHSGSSENRLERHHRDRNVYNNDPANVELLCRTCHLVEHGASARAPDPAGAG